MALGLNIWGEERVASAADMRVSLSSGRRHLGARNAGPLFVGPCHPPAAGGVPGMVPWTRVCESDIRVLANAFRLSGWGLPPV
jgi:hypothetical protein